ncbi:restriction-modification enzyme subunit S1B [Mycoplasmopsis californica]|uniref:Restriction endonuclease subunit S n=1 Tax=Mycoplasmopsis equigenitalium TaxID=114883 RepID=A0ABY5J2N4_9BACT|nr:restriction endonuclease subunit S [Mycoplasmopsis equigenitalium]UUD37260.1 restriction endonuclease subunit S [Mycoplasmopsis equigenitalium]VEU69432.1 restriction-modification enzyme subunit S1B [Mycoplasmopsis californica]
MCKGVDKGKKVPNVPNLRFKKFNTEISRCELKSIFNISVGGDINKSKVKHVKDDVNKYPIIANALINNGFYGYTDSFKQENCVTVSGRGDIGIAVARPYKFYPIVRLLSLKPIYKSDLKYFESLLNSKKMLIESTGVPQLTSPQISKIKISFCDYDEQLEIGNFLTKIDQRIETQNKIISKYESLIKIIRKNIILRNKWEWIKLKHFVDNEFIKLQRGNIIPKFSKDNEKFIYPVYSSSVHNDGLMGYYDSFMFDEKLITWSIDGGGNFFLRNKHQYNVTNVCGILKIIKPEFDYAFLYEMLTYQHLQMTFNYQNKAHPSVIKTLYSLPIVPIKQQKKIAEMFSFFHEKTKLEEEILCKYKSQKEYLLTNMFI